MRRVVGIGFAAAMVLWLVAPVLVVLPLSVTDKPSFAFPPKGFSLEWYRKLFTDPAWYDALLASVRVGLMSALVATALGTAAAVGLWRAGPRVRVVAGAVMLAPMIVPVIVLAVGIYSLFIALGLVGTELGFVVAHSVLGLPLVIVNVLAGLQSFDRRLELAAASLGAGRWTVLRTVTLPHIYGSILAGALLAFVTSFDEVVLSVFIQSPYLRTLPVQMFSSVAQDVDPTIVATAATMVVLTTALVVLALLGAGRALRRR